MVTHRKMSLFLLVLLSLSLPLFLSERRPHHELELFLKKSVSQLDSVMSVLMDTRSYDTDLAVCKEMMDSAKDQMVRSMKELHGGNPSHKSYENIHTWLSGVLTSYIRCKDDISSGVSKGRVVEPQLEGLISRANMALDIFISISPVKDEFNMVEPDRFPTWLTSRDRKLLISTPEALKMKADIVVAQDGTGKYKTVNEAVDAAPDHSKRRFIIYIKKGVYKEHIEIGTTKTKLTLIGDSRDTTILTGSLNYKDGYDPMKSATLATNANGFMAQDIWIRNTAGPQKFQAVALRVSGDVSVIYRCRIDGYQDALYAHTNRQFYRSCYIIGTVDFIFGDARAVFQNCDIVARKPGPKQSNMVTAQGRNSSKVNSGFSIQYCNISASSDLARVKGSVRTFLGRPWKILSRVVVMKSLIDNHVDPEGWAVWNNDIGRLSTLYYREYDNRGPGADTRKRVKWQGYKVVTNPKEVEKFTVANFIDGELWLNETGVPYHKGL